MTDGTVGIKEKFGYIDPLHLMNILNLVEAGDDLVENAERLLSALVNLGLSEELDVLRTREV